MEIGYGRLLIRMLSTKPFLYNLTRRRVIDFVRKTTCSCS